MLVKAKRKGYYGSRVREVGQTFNYTPMTKDEQKAYKKKHNSKDDYFPSWMEKVNISENAAETLEAKLENLSKAVDEARKNLATAEAGAQAADDKLSAATKQADKEVAADEASAANDAVDDATQALSDAEDELAAAESA